MIYLVLYVLFILPFNGKDRLQTSNAILEVSQEFKYSKKDTMQWVALLAQESAFNTKAVNKRSGTLGIGQISPRYLKSFQKSVGLPNNPLTLVGGLRLSAYVFKKCLGTYKDHRRRYACYFAGRLNPCTVHLEKNKDLCPETYRHALAVENKYLLIRTYLDLDKTL